MNFLKRTRRIRRHARVRAKIAGTGERPRLSVFRSNRYVTIQLIDDTNGRTVAAIREEKNREAVGRTKRKRPAERGREVGVKIAEKALAQGILAAVFDRGGYAYHGMVKAIAEGARQGGLKI